MNEDHRYSPRLSILWSYFCCELEKGNQAEAATEAGLRFFANPHIKNLRFWLRGGWVGGLLGFSRRWQVGGWVPIWGFLNAQPH